MHVALVLYENMDEFWKTIYLYSCIASYCNYISFAYRLIQLSHSYEGAVHAVLVHTSYYSIVNKFYTYDIIY